MTYDEASRIALLLSTAQTKAAQLLRAKTTEMGKPATFVIMRFGDPRKWRRLPTTRDGRSTRKHHLNDGVTACKGRTKDWRLIVHTRSCTLEHAETGRVIEAPSIVSFCEQAGPNHSVYHITPILDGDRPSYKGWYRPDFLNQVLHLRDLYDNEYTLTVREWVRDHKRSAGSAARLLAGVKQAEYRGDFRLASSTHQPALKLNPLKITQVEVVKDGRTYVGASMREAAEKAGVERVSNLYGVAYGRTTQTEGVQVKSVTTERKRALEVL